MIELRDMFNYGPFEEIPDDETIVTVETLRLSSFLRLPSFLRTSSFLLHLVLC